MEKRVKLPKVPDSNSISIIEDNLLIHVGYTWKLDPNTRSFEEQPDTEDDVVIFDNLLSRNFTVDFKLYKKIIGTLGREQVGQDILRHKRIYYQMHREVSRAHSNSFADVINLISGKFGNDEVERLFRLLWKYSIIMSKHLGESEYGKSRLTNAFRFSFDELEELAPFSGEYKESEFDIKVFNKKLNRLKKLVPHVTATLGTAKEITNIKFQ